MAIDEILVPTTTDGSNRLSYRRRREHNWWPADAVQVFLRLTGQRKLESDHVRGELVLTQRAQNRHDHRRSRSGRTQAIASWAGEQPNSSALAASAWRIPRTRSSNAVRLRARPPPVERSDPDSIPAASGE